MYIGAEEHTYNVIDLRLHILQPIYTLVQKHFLGRPESSILIP